VVTRVISGRIAPGYLFSRSSREVGDHAVREGVMAASKLVAHLEMQAADRDSTRPVDGPRGREGFIPAQARRENRRARGLALCYPSRFSFIVTPWVPLHGLCGEFDRAIRSVQ
jgi:hypothetical protein